MAQKENVLLPKTNRDIVQLVPAKEALAVTNDSSISTSTEITLNTLTGLVEVTAINDHVFLKYGTDNVTTTDFDEFIHVGTTRHYVIPVDITAINIIDNGSNGQAIVIEK